MNKAKEIFQVLSDVGRALPTLLFYKPPTNDQAQSMAQLLEQTVKRYPSHTAIVFEGRELSWFELNALSNRFAHLLKTQGLSRGDAIALLMENRIEMLATVFAAAKIGVAAGLINTSLRGKPLVHCINTIEAKKCVVGAELIDAIDTVRSELNLIDKSDKTDYLYVEDPGNSSSYPLPTWAIDFSLAAQSMPEDNLAETASILAGEKALYVFTSGTTGLPKAATIYHRRYLSAAVPYSKIGFRAKATDRMYICLPLYHITGLGPGVGSCIASGATIVLRRRFSARQFWPEVQQHKTNLFVYVGELCRYLAMQEVTPEETNHPITCMLGNGLRPDVWDTFRDRFKIKRITEIYGASESNAFFINLLNKDRTIGTASAPIILAQYDVDADEIIVDSDGKIVPAVKGEPGLLLSKITEKYRFDGYKDAKASESKILHDVQTAGDRWFNTGDLIRQIDVGFAMGLPHFQFVDRVGDTFRWRAENVSTNEVAEILTAFDSIAIANVYGVAIPGIEGKAGMAAITLKPDIDFDIAQFSQFCRRELPSHARPVFIRIQPQAETTVTFKLFKGKLRKEAYHLDQVEEPMFVMKPRSSHYEALDTAFYQQLVDGKSGY